ncbi:AAA family ATPase [Lentibacillus sp. CBA3610]|uniref:AAA family ATPase n=1 Tax=Lentibacillus sp. CBA3610 TaxID=2518176 RepID=UPI001596062D|nr:AAA family ATPase [Lentibacillus sp. CBA3610]QKY70286.1 hypothetical protein Len3610_12385 [Lentibacillus sp. CBA3610]
MQGKTTLSRILRSLEKKEHHEDFESGKFDITLDDDQVINDIQLEQSNLNVRVYNSDYRKENLSILYDKEGNIRPFTILGEKNIEIEKEMDNTNELIKGLNKELGNIQEKTGIRWEIKQLDEAILKTENNLKKKFTEKASQINRDTELFKSTQQKKQYNRNDLEKDAEIAKTLTASDKQMYKNTLNDEIKPIIEKNDLKDNEESISSITKETNELLLKDVKPSNTIDYLLENNELQQWVKEGADLHRGKRNRCAFCQGKLDDELWNRIDEHFTKESEKYAGQIKILLDKVQKLLRYWEDKTLANKDQFYSKFHNEYEKVNEQWSQLRTRQIENLKYILEVLTERKQDIFSSVNLELNKINDISDEVTQCLEKFSEIVDKNNAYSGNLGHEQDKARNELRLDEIHTFMEAIDYKNQLIDIGHKKKQKEDKDERKDEIIGEIEKSKNYIKGLESQINDEEKAVNQINLYLKSFLGHPELSLEVEKQNDGKDKHAKFSIKRNNEPAYNLSEGEQSLIAFCYFLANLKDITNPEEYIIFIDDPISSLDGNNLFYVFSLIDSEIASKHYKQIFISTHNLDLLKYLHRINTPTNNNKWNNKFFVIEKRRDMDNNLNSNIIDMPDYLRKYSTEFTYLFKHIAIVATEEQNDSNNHTFYSFPNTARKFLESYLFFRYPDHTLKNDKRLKKFFGEGLETVSFINRINNEFSHGENQFDRLERPIDIPEFKKDAQLILTRIAEKDWEQFNSLCSSVGLNAEEVSEIYNHRESYEKEYLK